MNTEFVDDEVTRRLCTANAPRRPGQFYQEILSWDYYEALNNTKAAEKRHSPDLVREHHHH